MNSSSRLTLTALSALTLSTGLVDAITVLGMGVFAANMTGNIVFLGFSLGGAPGYSVFGSLAALVGFLLGAWIGGFIVSDKPSPGAAGRALGLQAALMGASALVAWFVGIGMTATDGWGAWAVLAVLGIAMGLQNVVALKSPVADMKTTVMTLTVASLAADFARGKNATAGLRIYSVVLLLLGALGGTLLFYAAGLAWTILAAAVAVAIAAILTSRTGTGDRAPDTTQ
jgi:uncharacterized membrane protein YoaK (UPF0700 family)